MCYDVRGSVRVQPTGVYEHVQVHHTLFVAFVVDLYSFMRAGVFNLKNFYK